MSRKTNFKKRQKAQKRQRQEQKRAIRREMMRKEFSEEARKAGMSEADYAVMKVLGTGLGVPASHPTTNGPKT